MNLDTKESSLSRKSVIEASPELKKQEPAAAIAIPNIKLHMSDIDCEEQAASENDILGGTVDGDMPNSQSGVNGIKLHKIDSDAVSYSGARVLRSENRKKVPWKKEELDVLIRGVEEYGLSNWRRVLEAGKDVFDKRRRPVDLIDKYRQYTKSTSFYTTAKRNWIELLDDDSARQDMAGEIIVYKEKFPYDAAMRFAKRRAAKEDPDQNFIIKIQDVDNPDKMHLYAATPEGSAIRIRKLSFTDKGN